MKILISSIVDIKRSAPQRLHYLCKYLSQNHDVTVLCINDHWKALQGGSRYLQGFDYGNAKVVYLTEKRMSPVLQELTINPPDIPCDVHLNFNSLVVGYKLARRLKARGIHTLYDIADDLPKQAGASPVVPKPLHALGRRFARTMLQRNYAISRQITFVTDKLKAAYLVPAGKGIVVKNGVDLEMFKPQDATELRRSLGLDGSFVVGFVGAIREWIDFRPVFGAMKTLSNVKALIVGDEGGMCKAHDLATEYGVNERVAFTGTLPFVKVPAAINAMDCCVMPITFSNAIPLCVLQELACGKPVIATKPIELPDDLYYLARTEREYANEIYDLQHKGYVGGLCGRLFVEQYHSWQSVVGQIESILEEIRGTEIRNR